MAYSVALKEQGVMASQPHPPAEGVNWPGSQFHSLKWARVTVTLDTTSYSTGGTALNILAALTGWTRICDFASQTFLQGTTVTRGKPYLENHATGSSRLLQLWSTADTPVQHAAAATTACVFDMYLIGY